MGEEGVQQDADRASRIAARCKRIQEKLAAVRQGDSSGAQEVAQQQEMSKTMQQLHESCKVLVKLKYDTQLAVTAVRVAGDEQESIRRQKDERVRQELRGKLLAEAEAAAAANATIAARWSSVVWLNVPQDMFQAIEQQRLACEAVIASKESLIADIRTALKSKDEDYVKLLKRQAADIDTMLAAMSQQLKQMTAAYREQLDNVERVLLQERADLVSSNRKEVAVLLEARAAAEANFTDKYLAAVEKYAHNLEELRHADAEEYQIIKIKLESDIAVLEQHLEKMRATYQLNAEKLEYNYRVLLERDAENSATINQQKRKLSRQHDVLLNLKNKYSRSDTKFCDENSKLTEEYKRITEHFKDMQAKFCHFGKVDATKYSQLWKLQQQEASDLAKQLLAADRVIHEQQLGWQWQPPDAVLFTSPHDPLMQANIASTAQQGTTAGDASDPGGAAAAATTVAAAGACSYNADSCTRDGVEHTGGGDGDIYVQGGEAAAGGVSAGHHSQDEGTRGPPGHSSSSSSRRSRRSSSVSGAGPGAHLPGAVEVTQRLTSPRYYGALSLLVDEAMFLVESRAAALLEELPANEAKLVAAESIVRALGVTDGPGFDALMDALTADGGSGAASEGPGAPVLIHPNDALLRLKAFVEAEAGISQPGMPSSNRAGSAAAGTGDAAASGTRTTSPGGASTTVMAGMMSSSGGGYGSSSSSSMGAATTTAAAAAACGGTAAAFRGPVISRRAADREREFWERLTRAVSDRVMRVWGKLERQLGSYHKLLVQRGEGLTAISKLQQENEELRGLLNQYLGSKINTELQIPPMAVL